MEDSNHPTLWFQDGNIVLRAHLEEGRLLRFRVHQFMLAHHSPVFSDMFTLPNPAAADTYEGSPSVDMPDKAEDLEGFLRVLYDPSALPYKTTKYQVEPLRTRIVEHVKADWPQTLVEWDRLETDIAQLAQAHAAVKTALGRSRYRIDGRYLDQRVAEPVAAIRLAREFNIPSILPAAFYTLARISPEHDRHPHPETLGPTIWSQWDTQPAFRTARWSLLTTEDYRCLVRGQSMILDQHFRINGCYVNDDCESRTECDEAWGDQMLNGFEILNHVTNHDVLQAWAEFYSPQRLRDSGLCWSCRDHHAKRANLAREEVWDGLPSWFGLAED